jgi:hypothetical protein
VIDERVSYPVEWRDRHSFVQVAEYVVGRMAVALENREESAGE